MKCPLCNGDYEKIHIKAVDGSSVEAMKCLHCSGIWFSRPLKGNLDQDSIADHDSPAPNYSTKSSDFTCPADGTLLQAAEHDVSPHSGQYWSCPDCDGMFFPRGQLALHQRWLRDQQGTDAHRSTFSRARASTAVLSVFILVVAILAALSRVDLQAAQTQALPNTGPNVLTLIMLAVTYLAGTILAVLGRRLPIIFTGWAVIVICLFGFSVIIFGP